MIRKPMRESVTKSQIDTLKRQGYSCVYDMSDSKLTLLDKTGKVIKTQVGKSVDSLVYDFSQDPISLDTSISFEDYCLAILV